MRTNAQQVFADSLMDRVAEGRAELPKIRSNIGYDEATEMLTNQEGGGRDKYPENQRRCPCCRRRFVAPCELARHYVSSDRCLTEAIEVQAMHKLPRGDGHFVPDTLHAEGSRTTRKGLYRWRISFIDECGVFQQPEHLATNRKAAIRYLREAIQCNKPNSLPTNGQTHSRHHQ